MAFKPLKFAKKHALFILALAVLAVMAVLFFKKEGLEAFPTSGQKVGTRQAIGPPIGPQQGGGFNSTGPQQGFGSTSAQQGLGGSTGPQQGTSFNSTGPQQGTGFNSTGPQQGGGFSSTGPQQERGGSMARVTDGPVRLGTREQNSCSRALSEAMASCR